MKYICGNEATLFKCDNTAIALGKFDGIHIGHQLLMDGIKNEKEQGRTSLVFTFGEHPNAILNGNSLKKIYTFDEKKYYFEQLDVDVVLEYPFTKEFASYLPEEFVLECLVKQLGVKSIYIGSDFCFGKNRCGNVAILKQLGEKYHFEVHEFEKKTLHGNVVSSSDIRTYIETDFELANEMLGEPYFVYGTVVHGNHLGNTIGFPTINQKIDKNKVTPSFGVYISLVEIDGVSYYGISNLGKKPTVSNDNEVLLETYIFDFEGNLYEKDICTKLLKFIRNEQKFSSVDALKAQIEKDQLCARAYIDTL